VAVVALPAVTEVPAEPAFVAVPAVPADVAVVALPEKVVAVIVFPRALTPERTYEAVLPIDALLLEPVR
jgi:hypothetical protein